MTRRVLFTWPWQQAEAREAAAYTARVEKAAADAQAVEAKAVAAKAKAAADAQTAEVKAVVDAAAKLEKVGVWRLLRTTSSNATCILVS